MERENVKSLQSEVKVKLKNSSKIKENIKDGLLILTALGATAGWIAFCEKVVNPRVDVSKAEKSLQEAVLALVDEETETQLQFASINSVLINANDNSVIFSGVAQDAKSTYNMKVKLSLDEECFAQLEPFTYETSLSYLDLNKAKTNWDLSSYGKFINVLNKSVRDEDTVVLNYEESLKYLSTSVTI